MKIIKIVLPTLIVIMFSACLKSTDNNFLNSSPAGNGITASFINVGASGISQTTDQSVGVTLSSQPGVYNFYVQLNSTSGSYPATTVTIDNTSAQALVSAFNAANAMNSNYVGNGGDTSYQVLPDSTFKWLNTTATVDPTTHLAVFQLQITSTKVDLATDLSPTIGYALGITIKSCSSSAVSIPSNTNTKIILIKVRNAYDASYTVDGYFFHPSSPRAITQKIKSLSTVSIVTSIGDLGDLGGSGYQFQFDVSPTNTLTNWVNQGSTPAVPASGFMTKDNPAGIPTYPGTTTGFVAKTYNNTYDATNMIFWMHYGYGVGAPNQNGYGRQVYEKWVRN